MMVALYRANPDAFYRDNINNLKSGVRLRVPSDEELYRLSDAEVFATLREHKARWQQDNEKARLEQEEAAKRAQLQQVTEDNAEVERRNQELKQRLARLEQQMNSMSRQVLEYAPQTTEPPAKMPEAPRPVTAPAKASETEGLSAGWMLALMVLVSGMVFGIWRYAPRRARRRG